MCERRLSFIQLPIGFCSLTCLCGADPFRMILCCECGIHSRSSIYRFSFFAWLCFALLHSVRISIWPLKHSTNRSLFVISFLTISNPPDSPFSLCLYALGELISASYSHLLLFHFAFFHFLHDTVIGVTYPPFEKQTVFCSS